MITKRDLRLGKSIKHFRKQQKFTQEKLAEKVRVTPKYIQFIESAKRKPSLKLLYRIAAAFKVKPSKLLP